MADQDSRYPICRHIKTNGYRCQSPALAGETFCYYHAGLHTNHPAPLTARKIMNNWKEGVEEGFRLGGEDPYLVARAFPTQNEYNFPPLEDAESIQLASSILFHAVAQGQIHPLRARVLLHALSVANNSLRIRRLAPPADPAAVVRATERAPNGEAIAPADAASAEPASQPESKDDFAGNPNE